MRRWANKITGPNAGGPRQFPIRTPMAARVGQFYRSAISEFKIPLANRLTLFIGFKKSEIIRIGIRTFVGRAGARKLFKTIIILGRYGAEPFRKKRNRHPETKEPKKKIEYMILKDQTTEPNQAMQRTSASVTDRAPSSTLRASHSRL